MASGHVNRIYRPNTWLHRPSLRREDFSCQPGAVHTWHFSDVAARTDDVSSWGGGLKQTLRVRVGLILTEAHGHFGEAWSLCRHRGARPLEPRGGG